MSESTSEGSQEDRSFRLSAEERSRGLGPGRVPHPQPLSLSSSFLLLSPSNRTGTRRESPVSTPWPCTSTSCSRVRPEGARGGALPLNCEPRGPAGCCFFGPSLSSTDSRLLDPTPRVPSSPRVLPSCSCRAPPRRDPVTTSRGLWTRGSTHRYRCLLPPCPSLVVPRGRGSHFPVSDGICASPEAPVRPSEGTSLQSVGGRVWT